MNSSLRIILHDLFLKLEKLSTSIACDGFFQINHFFETETDEHFIYERSEESLIVVSYDEDPLNFWDFAQSCYMMVNRSFSTNYKEEEIRKKRLLGKRGIGSALMKGVNLYCCGSQPTMITAEMFSEVDCIILNIN